ncbi:SDR family NAD(P)-dependent oxidoreductase [Flavivirga sp. 57AJ16]|uniref:SDR family NAD(P)-dependent oxidoreductase n=1 Tax=Flavivirga sp. 57AJ16 TaxID=3025307 RepID=UPI0023668AB5|nr:SDR family oxidoreductase [Flavivirga sp. 57AJ16]MDD7886015.1 SDR family oxidoreductase [Flavivirga sp. 57AJ16]
MNQSKIALVTGGSRGLGKDMALNLAKKGLDLIITYHSNEAAAKEVVSEVAEIGQKAMALQLDVAEYSEYEPFFKKLSDVLQESYNTSTIDYLINNAGSIAPAPYISATIDEFKDMIHIHLMGPFFIAQNALQIMNDGGGIVNISTGLTRFTTPGFATYASMKGGLEILTKYQAKELGERKIRVNSVAPGAIETDIMGGAVRDNAELNKALAEDTALGRVGVPSDVGSVVAFLCTEDAKWINGQRIEVSGGANL